MEKYDSAPLKNKASLAELLKRPEITYENMVEIDKDREELSDHAVAQLQVQIKYAGYIGKQLSQIERFKKLENKPLSQDIVYDNIEGLRIEARQKLEKFRPVNIGQASRIGGVNPADISVLIVYLDSLHRRSSDSQKV